MQTIEFHYEPAQLPSHLYNTAILLCRGFSVKEISKIEGVSRHEIFGRRTKILLALAVEKVEDLSIDLVERAQRPHLNGIPLPWILISLTYQELSITLLKAMEWEPNTIAEFMDIPVNDVERTFHSSAHKAGYQDPYYFLYRVRCTGLVSGIGRNSVFDRLSEAEKEVAIFSARGENIYEVAQKTDKSHRTVKNQLTSIYQKLGINCQNDLMVLAIDAGLVNIGELAASLSVSRSLYDVST